MAKEQRIFHGFRHQWPGELLEAGSETCRVVVAIFRKIAGKNTYDQAQSRFRGVNACDNAIEQRHVRGG